MKRITISLLPLVAAGLLAGCATVPQAPTVAVMPGPGKPLDEFQRDDYFCRQYARQQVGVDPNAVAQQQVLSGAAVGGALGALGGLIMGGGDDPGLTRSMAGAGLLMGSAMGAGAAQQSQFSLQRRYNIAYMQCMYARGNAVPGYPRPRYVPPPPPGSPPPPPPPGGR
ncbi:glycine zipper family protein [Acidihalobacter prosperus]|uniref:Glycine-zipper-containing OmpA-like membrane domain-containing protein n=1 Tax=Acidihalobacter prosperus TaxID=160660 RepID=A0A1A6C612_9GAMM|nr:glycine zipper family protein [Acidihalobacter prosperus]OBS09980.1 hypothetical protein Thpro_021030 [Acidihalobacter prosperus]